jgi:hypothetical protein
MALMYFLGMVEREGLSYCRGLLSPPCRPPPRHLSRPSRPTYHAKRDALIAADSSLRISPYENVFRQKKIEALWLRCIS